MDEWKLSPVSYRTPSPAGSLPKSHSRYGEKINCLFSGIEAVLAEVVAQLATAALVTLTL